MWLSYNRIVGLAYSSFDGIVMSRNMGVCIQWGYLSGCTHGGRKSTVGHEHEETWKVRLHVKMRWIVKISQENKHKSNAVGIGVFLHDSGGVTCNDVLMIFLEVFLHTCEQLQA